MEKYEYFLGTKIPIRSVMSNGGWDYPKREFVEQRMKEIKENEAGDRVVIEDGVMLNFDMNKYIFNNEPMRCNLFLVELPEIENLNCEDIVSFKDIVYKPKGFFRKRNKDVV